MVKAVGFFVLVFGGVISLVVVAILRDFSERQKRPRIQKLIRARDDLAIIGDGAWIDRPRAPRSARIRDLPARGSW